MIRKLYCVLLAAFLAAGCAGPLKRSGEIRELHLFGLPVTVNLDNRPGSDGFAARVYATKGIRAKGVAIQSGVLEVLMFDGVVSAAELRTKEPTQMWRFTARELSRLEEQTSLGLGYRFALRWTNAPTRGHITVLARHLPKNGQPVYSSPSAITAGTR